MIRYILYSLFYVECPKLFDTSQISGQIEQTETRNRKDCRGFFDSV